MSTPEITEFLDSDAGQDGKHLLEMMRVCSDSRKSLLSTINSLGKTVRRTLGPAEADKVQQAATAALEQAFDDRILLMHKKFEKLLRAEFDRAPKVLLPSCSVCHEQLVVDSLSTLDCGHVFCSECARRHRNDTMIEFEDDGIEVNCPVCRTSCGEPIKLFFS